MASNDNVPNKICLYPDQLTSLLSLARILPWRKYTVLLALFHYLEGDCLKSTARRDQIEVFTGLGKRTIYTCIKEFEACGLIKQWRGPFEVKQKFYRINLPAPDRVFEFYGEVENGRTSSQAGRKKSRQPVQTDSNVERSISVLRDTEDTIVEAESLSVEGSRNQVSFQDSPSSGAPSLPPDDVQRLSRASAELTEFDTTVAQDASSGLSRNHERSSESMTDITDNADHPSESFFDDPRLDLLIAHIEEGRKDGTLLIRWLKSQNMLLYWPPTDSYRVDKEMLRKSVKTLDDLNVMLTAPVRPEYEWFVEEFLQVCRDSGFQVADTSERLGLEINMLLDSMLKQTRHGKADWTPSSIKAQLRMMIEEWEKVPNWKQLRLSVQPPQEPTLEFLVTTRAVWEATRERWIEEQEAGILNFLDRFESSGINPQSTYARASR